MRPIILRITLLVVLAAVAAAAFWTRPEPAPAPTPIADAAPPEPEPGNALRPPTWNVPRLLDDGDWASLRTAIERSRRYLARKDPAERFVFGPRELSADQLLRGLDRALAHLADDPAPELFAERMARDFELFESSDPHVLVTGYYEPILDGSLTRRPGYEIPIYGPPSGTIRVDLGAFNEEYKGKSLVGRLEGGRLVPLPERREIRRGAALRSPTIAWAADRIDLFFLEIQGSGTLRLPDGGEQRIGYAGSNGRPYRSIGKLLIDEGAIPRERMSMQALRVWLDANPDQVERVLDHNASQVFFRKLDGEPLGSLGVPVTPERSIATDRNLFPKGALAFLVTTRPALAADGTTDIEGPLTRFVLNQDTGGAIRGPGRVDFFWGRGREPAARAGAMKQDGRIFFLLPRLDASP